MQRRFWVCIYPLTMCWTWERDSAISEAQNMFWSPKSSMSYARAPFRVLNHPFRLLLWEHTYIEWQTVKSVRFRAIRFDTIVAHPFQKCENYRKSTTNAEPQKNGSSDTNAERKRDRTSVRKGMQSILFTCWWVLFVYCIVLEQLLPKLHVMCWWCCLRNRNSM